MASSTTRVSVSAAIVKDVVQCFGIPSVTPTTVLKIVEVQVLDDLGHNMSVAAAESIASAGMVGTVLFGGLPLFLAAGAVNLPIVVPATVRLLLMLACDVMLILTEAFKEATRKCIGQPLQKDVEAAAQAYREAGTARQVHKRLKKLVPRSNIVKSYRTERIRRNLMRTITDYKGQIMSNMEANVTRQKEYIDSESDDDTLMDEEGELMVVA